MCGGGLCLSCKKNWIDLGRVVMGGGGSFATPQSTSPPAIRPVRCDPFGTFTSQELIRHYNACDPEKSGFLFEEEFEVLAERLLRVWTLRCLPEKYVSLCQRTLLFSQELHWFFIHNFLIICLIRRFGHKVSQMRGKSSIRGFQLVPLRWVERRCPNILLADGWLRM